MSTFADIKKQLLKDYGAHAAQAGDEFGDAQRIPSGIFPLDLMLGGGFPRGKISEIFGIESCCKSNIAYKVLGQHQRLFPELKTALVDVENSFTAPWGRVMGIDPAELLVLKPDYGEQAVDMIESLMASPECGIVLLDSLAAMVTTREGENSAEKEDPGGQAKVGKKLTNKVTMVQRKVEVEDLLPTFMYVNQLKYKIGVMYGDPATTPGGNSPRFAASIRLRVYAKDIKEEKWSTTHAARKEIRVTVVKHKVPIVARECMFEMAMIPHAGMKPGDVDDWKTVWYYLQKHGLVSESGKGYALAGKSYATQKAIKQMLDEDQETRHTITQSMIATEVAAAYTEEHQGKKKEG